MVLAVSPDSTRNSTWVDSLETGVVRAVPRFSLTMSSTNGNLSAVGLSSAKVMTVLATTGRSAVRATANTTTARTSAKTRNFSRPTTPWPPPPPPPPLPRDRGTGSENSGMVSVA